MKKSVKSIILALLTLVMLTAAFPTAVLASDSSFQPRLSAPGRSNSYYNRSLNAFAKTGYGMPNCTAYAYGRIYEITGSAPLISGGNAGSWWSINKRNGYYEYGQEPKLGAIACWSNHVAVVEAIDGNTVTASQSHWGGTYFDTCTFTSGTSHFGQKFYGYIYASDSVLEVEEEPVYVYKLEKPAFDINKAQNENPFSNIDLTYNNEPNLLMNSYMLTNAVL
ncbi:MAG: CHAP domain-containing protein [Eubacterium sp.]|nr:CHAP domain-containing protein [Eubacterium sp.]